MLPKDHMQISLNLNENNPGSLMSDRDSEDLDFGF